MPDVGGKRTYTRACGRMKLVVPARERLPSYLAALERGWSPDNVRGRAAAEEQLEQIARDPDAFLASLDDPEARGDRVKLLDGSKIKRLPGIGRWIWDGEFCGSIGLRWQEGAVGPTSVLDQIGHIGFAIVPWKRRQRLGSAALSLMLEEARSRGLVHVELVTVPENVASRRTIEANGGILVEAFRRNEAFGGGEALRFRIMLGVPAAS
jgi:predicted acetyltransferase